MDGHGSRSGLCASLSEPPRLKRNMMGRGHPQTAVSPPMVPSSALIHPEPEDFEDTTLLDAPAGDLTACMSWYNCLSSTAPNIIKVSLLPVVSPPCESNSTPVPSSSSGPFAVVPPVSAYTSESLKQFLLKKQDRTSTLTSSSSRRTTDPYPTDPTPSIAIIKPRDTKSSINVFEDWEPVLDISSSTSSIEPRSIVSYGIMGTLGQGSYGKVMLAYLKKRPDEGLYAVKMLRKTETVQYGKEAHTGELDTLQMVASVRHINEDGIRHDGGRFLQRLADHFQDDRFNFIVLEYHPTTLSEPETASRFLIREKSTALSASISLPVAGKGHRSSLISYEDASIAVRLLAAEISLGLLFLHRNGIVHQDIKPANIMISGAGHVIIGDFGAASRLPRLNSGSSVALSCYTHPNDHRGAIVLQPEDFVTFTPLYAAPEMRERNLQGLVVYDERADWWSLGVVLYELITGNTPFNSCGRVDTMERLRRTDGDHSLSFGHLEKLSISWSARGDCSVPLESFIRSLLLHNPDDRLSGQDVLKHHFFDPIQTLWNEVLALKLPPCPNPPISPIDNDVSLDFCSYPPSAHGDEFIQSAHHFGHDRLPDEEAVCGPQGFANADESSGSSVIQAMPSSASIWFNPGVNSAANIDTFTSEGNGSALHISMDTFNMVRSSVTLHRFFAAQNTSTPQPRLGNTLGRVDRRFPSSPLNRPNDVTAGLPTDVALPEIITMSLLEAMDSRDRQGVGAQVDGKRKGTNGTASGSGKLIKRAVRWVWRKLNLR